MSGGLTVNDDVRPANGTYAVQDIYVRGGLRILDNTTDISAIPTGNSNLRIGQRAYVVNTGVEYRLSSLTLGGGFTNGTWVVYSAPTNAGSWTGVDTVATSNITLSGEQTLHGVTTSGSRVLVTGQTTSSQNGPYVSAAGAWTRTTDADSAGEFAIGKLVSVTNASSDLFGTIWTCVDAVTTLGTDPITFVENAASGTAFNPSAPGDIGGSTPGAGTFTDLVTTVSNLFGNTIAFANGVSNFDGLKSVNYTADADKDITGIPNAYNGPVLKIKATVGGGLTAPRKLTVPFGGPWFVINTTTQTINFGNGSSTIAIAAGAMAVVMSDLTAMFYGASGAGGDTTDATTHTANFTCNATDAIVLYSTSGGAFTATLPASPTRGMKRVLKDDGLAIDTNALTVSSGSSAKVQNPATGSKSATSVDLGTATGLNNGASVAFLFNGTDWVVL